MSLNLSYKPSQNLVCQIIILFTMCGMFFIFNRTSDGDLLTQFRKHERELNLLVKMSNEDSSLGRVSPTFVRSRDGVIQMNTGGAKRFISQDRWDMYRSLLHQCALTSGFSRESTCIFFPIDNQGMGNGNGYEKGFAFLPESAQPVVLPSLDFLTVMQFNWTHKKLRSKPKFRVIESNWYLYESTNSTNLNGYSRKFACSLLYKNSNHSPS